MDVLIQLAKVVVGKLMTFLLFDHLRIALSKRNRQVHSSPFAITSTMFS